MKCIFQIGFANDATLYRVMHKWDSAAAPLLLCADNIRFHGCGSSYCFLSNFGGAEEAIFYLHRSLANFSETSKKWC